MHTGVLAAMWPCGIITLLCELFISESKSQVYAHLLQFLQTSQEASSKLSKFIWSVSHCVKKKKTTEYICYDDGCHLRKYAQNPIRRDQTPTTQFLSRMEIVVDKIWLGMLTSACISRFAVKIVANFIDKKHRLCKKIKVGFLCTISFLIALFTGWHRSLQANFLMVVTLC